ncbi:MAG: type I-U CRISPR-associated helicase/endonuclease Cas3, partial [Chloroflexi bacterium]|nr:type I-U CRISPR-associated helicase/endonuclease Cas3 [Chloroflexota bacterium]
VVDRRAVVDQATDVAMRLREYVDRQPALKRALGLEEGRSLPISTLRGQQVDNKEWLEDPASPAIIVGTVDMVGSRLLFEGYGISRKMRPYHAGLLGADTLVVLDEAHLVPPFEKLLETVAEGSAVFGPREDALRKLVPPFKLLALSATGRALASKSFGLDEKTDLKHPVVCRRLDAPKRLTMHLLDDETKLKDALAEHAWKLADNGTRPVRVIVFCHKREDAAAAREAIEKRARGDKKAGIPKVHVDPQLFVGGRRVLERQDAAAWLKERGFIAGTKGKPSRPAFVFATSAGEVGVDLDADHMVADLVSWERMVQRLGRVNRRGDGEATVIVVVEPEPKPKEVVQDALAKDPSDRTEAESKAVAAHEASLAQARALRKPLDRLPRKNGAADGSPGALRELKLSAEADPELRKILDDATTPAPLRPALSRALVDAWSMTSLREHTGRPEIDPWLRGWGKDDPQTSVVWRTHLPVRTRGVAATKAEIEAFFEAAPPHASERLETETFRVVKWLAARAKALTGSSASQSPAAAEPGSESIDARQSLEAEEMEEIDGLDETEPPTEIEDEAAVDDGEGAPLRWNDIVGVVLSGAGDLRTGLRVADLLGRSDKGIDRKKREQLQRNLAGATLVVDARIGGLKGGLLDPTAKDAPRTVDDGQAWMAAGAPHGGDVSLGPGAPVVRFRVRVAEAGQPLPVDTQWRERFRFATELSDDGEPTRWLILEKWRHDAATEEDRSAGQPQLLDKHLAWTEERARDLARRLGLRAEYAETLAIAAGQHDRGKRANRWQRAFNAETDGVYAKTRGPVNTALLDGYRHEFGSLPLAAEDARLRALPEDLQDLALHLIAAHHGLARPLIGTGGCEDAPPSALEGRAQEVALRFARLQKRWGPWGLAWWEALLRAADQQASRDNDARDSNARKEGG